MAVSIAVPISIFSGAIDSSSTVTASTTSTSSDSSDPSNPDAQTVVHQIAANLTWPSSSSADLDLYVVEPNGVEVYYNNKNGTYGNL